VTRAQENPAGIVVVIVNYNAGAHLARTLEAVARQTLRPSRVIVVDNASTDGSAAHLGEHHPFVEVISPGSNLGFAAANNLGARQAPECAWIALLNPDAFPEPEWLEHTMRFADRAPDVAGFGARLLMADTPQILDGTGDVYHTSGFAWRRHHGIPEDRVPTAPDEVLGVCAAAACFRRQAWDAVGGFDERFFCYYEDVDLALRLCLAGFRCMSVPDARVHHVGSAVTGRESDFTVYHVQRNLVWTFVKNMPGGLFWRYLPQHVAVNVLAVVLFGMRGQLRPVLRAKCDAVRGLGHALRERRRLQRCRVLRPRDVRAKLARGLIGYRTAAERARLLES
jgi:GT2 family glycosyltransferase